MYINACIQIYINVGPRLCKAQEMCDEVYAQEPIETRHLNQENTAPVSEAAKEAREAILSVDI
jgi:hypothetical protein